MSSSQSAGRQELTPRVVTTACAQSYSKEDPSVKAMRERVVEAHGITMSLAFVVLFPLGALTIRFMSMRGIVWIHASAQLFAYAVALAGFGMGVWIAYTTDQVLSLFALDPS